MTEEEKQAIKDLKNIVDDLEDTEQGAIIALQQEEIDSLKILAELINKQQKEIKYLKGQIPQDKIFYYSEKDYISKVKIREKLDQIYEEYQKILSSNRNLQEKNIATFQHNAMRTVLEELLEE